MTSAINTGSLDANYPTPGVNNNSQGFRTNFATIKTNLDTAASEITDLQTKGIFKSALSGTVLNNDMANGLISNATTQGFSQVSYNLGANISGSLTVDKARGDYQYGIVTGNISTISFTNWGPSGNYSEVVVSLTVSPGQTIAIPSNVDANSTDTIEGYVQANSWVLVPANTYQVTWKFYTTDCGTTIQMAPIDRPRQTTQVYARTFSPSSRAGLPGDQPGDIAYSGGSLWVCQSAYNPSQPANTIWASIGGGGSSSSIVNGTSSVSVALNGNVNMNVNGSNIVSVTPVGVTLTGNANVSANLTVDGITTLGNVGNVHITGGTNGQLLTTDGTGNLSWSTVTGGGGAGNPGGTAPQIQFNNGAGFGGAPGLTYSGANSTTIANALVVNGAASLNTFTATSANISTANVSGNLTTANLSVTNGFMTGNISAGNINATGNITASNIVSVGSGPVSINSSTSILLNANASSNVSVANAAGLVLSGNFYLPSANYSAVAGIRGQMVVDVTGSKIWVCTGGSNWKSVNLT